MDKYVSANKLKAKVISGEPILFSEPTQHEIFFLLELEPSEDVEPVVHTHWIPCENEIGEGSNTYKCSACGEIQMVISGTPKENGWRFCPHCGAKMDGEKDK